MSKQGNLGFVMAVLLLLATLMSCGAPKNKQGGQTASGVSGQQGESGSGTPAQGVASKLGFRIVKVYSNDDHSESGPSGETSGLRATISENHVSFDEPIQLVEERQDSTTDYKVVHPFLVWSMNGLGSKISRASYQHQVRNAASHPRGKIVRDFVNFSDEYQNLYIPLMNLIGNKAENANPSDLHYLKLDLSLENGSTVEVEVVLRMHGPLAPIVAQNPAYRIPFEVHEEGRKLERGATFYSEEYANPSDRPLTLWVKKGGDASLDTGIKIYDERWAAGPDGTGPILIGGNWVYYFSNAGLTVSTVAAEIDGETRSGVDFEGNWVAFELNPHEVLRLAWKFTLGPGNNECALPGMGWVFSGFRIKGTWDHVVRVADRQYPATKATAPNLPREDRMLATELVQAKAPVKLQKGEVVAQIAFACQGYF